VLIESIIFLLEYYVVQAAQIAGRFPATLRHDTLRIGCFT